MNIVIEEVYPSEDDFGGDYWGIRVRIDGEIVAEYGDYYHDKGYDKALGFLDGFFFAKGVKPVNPKYKDVVDTSYF